MPLTPTGRMAAGSRRAGLADADGGLSLHGQQAWLVLVITSPVRFRIVPFRACRVPGGQGRPPRRRARQPPRPRLPPVAVRAVAPAPKPPRWATCARLIGGLPTVAGARLKACAGTRPDPLLLANVWLPEGVE